MSQCSGNQAVHIVGQYTDTHTHMGVAKIAAVLCIVSAGCTHATITTVAASVICVRVCVYISL